MRYTARDGLIRFESSSDVQPGFATRLLRETKGSGPTQCRAIIESVPVMDGGPGWWPCSYAREPGVFGCRNVASVGADSRVISVSAMTRVGGAGERAGLVTGVSRGLGAALASELLERGFRVVGIGRASNPVLTGERYVFVQFDLSGTTRSTRRWSRLERGYSPRAPSERISCGLSMVAAKYRRFRGTRRACTARRSARIS
jgi:hypothetical protein